MKKKPRKKTFLILAAIMSLLAIVSLAAYVGYYYGNWRVNVTVLYRVETVEEFARAQPLPLKANLLVVAGAHKAGADLELLEILGPWAVEKKRQLEEGKKEWVRQ